METEERSRQYLRVCRRRESPCRNLMKKKLSYALTIFVVALFSAAVVLGAPAERASGYSDGIFVYVPHGDGTAEINGLTEDGLLEERLEVPRTILSGTCRVTGIAAGAFRDANVLRTLIIPDSVKTIGAEMCWHCDNLRIVELPDALSEIGERAFGMCGQLLQINLPLSLAAVPAGLLYACGNLAEIALPPEISEIGASAFQSCRSLRSVAVPEGTRKVGEESFADCERLSSVILPESLRTIGAGAFSNCGKLKTLVLPDHLVEIADETFRNCVALTDIGIPEEVQRIGVRAFEYCPALREVAIYGFPSAVGERAFAGCTQLQQIAFGEGLEHIGDQAFYNVSLVCSLPVSLLSIGSEAFNGEDCVIEYAGSQMQWLRIGIGSGNTGISKIQYAADDDPGSELTVRDGSGLRLETLPGSAVTAVRGLSAGRTAPAAGLLMQDLRVADGEIAVLTAQGTLLGAQDGCGTGCIVEGRDIGNGLPLARAYVVVDGDVLGTGRMDISQLVRTCEAMTGTVSLTPLALAAVDTDNSGVLDIVDLVREARRLTGA